jgi:replicative DNA helicase
MLLSKDAIADVVEILRTADFYRPAHATIFDAVLDLYGRGEPADPITVAAALADSGDLNRIGGVPYLHDLVAIVPTAANASYYGRIVAERAVLRRLVEAGTRIVQLGYGAAGSGGRDVDDTVDLAQQEIYNVTERRGGDDFAILAELLQPTLDEIEAVGAQGGVMTGVPTGFTDLDRLLNGLHGGQLIIVAGGPVWVRLSRSTPRSRHRPDGRRWAPSPKAINSLVPTAGRPRFGALSMSCTAARVTGSRSPTDRPSSPTQTTCGRRPPAPAVAGAPGSSDPTTGTSRHDRP